MQLHTTNVKLHKMHDYYTKKATESGEVHYSSARHKNNSSTKYVALTTQHAYCTQCTKKNKSASFTHYLSQVTTREETCGNNADFNMLPNNS
jgi:hypothetical protein